MTKTKPTTSPCPQKHRLAIVPNVRYEHGKDEFIWAEASTITVNELIDVLMKYAGNLPVFIKRDDGVEIPIKKRGIECDSECCCEACCETRFRFREV